MGDHKILLLDMVAGIPESWRDHFCLEETDDRPIVCEYDYCEGAPHMRCSISTNAKYMEKNSFAKIDIFVCVGLKVFEPNAMCAYVFHLD